MRVSQFACARLLGGHLDGDVHRRVADIVDRRATGHHRPERDALPKIDLVDRRGDRGTPAMPDRRNRRRLVDHRHQVAAEEIAENVLHVRHDDRGNLAARVRHRTGFGESVHGQ